MLSKILSLCVSLFILSYGAYDFYSTKQIENVYSGGQKSKAIVVKKPVDCRIGYRSYNEMVLEINGVQKGISVGYDKCRELSINDTVFVKTDEGLSVVLLCNGKENHFEKSNYILSVCLIIVGTVFMFFTFYPSPKKWQ
jgi:hypothetical protein